MILVLARTFMSDYNWKSGVITDAELVFNLFCIYFDRRLNPDPRFLDGKVFRGNYIVKQAQLNSKHSLKSNDRFISDDLLFLDTARYSTALFIYQDKPPIYKVLSNGEIHDVPAVSKLSIEILCLSLVLRVIIICLIVFYYLLNV